HPMADFPPGDLEAEVKAYVDSVEDDLRVRKPIIEQIKDKTGTIVCSQRQEAMLCSFTLETEQGDTPRRNWRHIQLVGRELSPPSKIDSSQLTDQQGQSGSSEQDLEQSKSDIPCSPKPLGQVITRFGRAVKPNPKLVQFSVETSDCLRKEAVQQSGCEGPNALVPLSRWQEGEECV
ncbi:hypothetical protein QTP86_030619, partial [Hemibagrus guttatus]